LNAEQARIWRAVIMRDGGCSVRSGLPGNQVHHIISRGRKGAWDERNMLVLTMEEHLYDPMNSSDLYRYRDLCTLRARYGYEYPDVPWANILAWGLHTYGKALPWGEPYA